MVEQPQTQEIPPGLYVRTSGGNLRRAKKPTKLQRERMRELIFTRDGYTCVECGWTPNRSDYGLHLDHIYPYKYGGTFTEDNLQTLCAPCNLSKGARV